MNQDHEYTIYCSKCGAEMSNNSRYCMKCGHLNYDHEANENMKKFMPKEKKKAYQVGSGQSLVEGESSNHGVRKSAGTRTGNKRLCFFVNYFLYLLLLIGSFLICSKFSFELESIMTSNFPKFAILFSFIFLYQYALELIFIKCNRGWIEAVIPIYRSFVLARIVFGNQWIGILALIPGINVIYTLVLFYLLGKYFEYSPMLSAVLPIVYLPLMGFGSRLFKGTIYVESDYEKEVEKDYQYRKIFFITILLFFLIGISLGFMASMTNRGGDADTIDRIYFIYASKKIVYELDENLENEDVSCDGGSYSDSRGIYYFPFDDVGEFVSLVLYDFREPIHGYVVVDNTNGERQYSISLSDGNNGFGETKVGEVHYSTIESYQLTTEYAIQGKNTCRIIK